MAVVETESLVLKSYNLAEADKIVVLLTKDHGVVRAVAKGAKRLTSKFGSGLEPFSHLKVTYFEKDAVELVSLQNVELIRSSFKEASDPEFLRKFSYLSDLVVSILPPHDPSELMYRMFMACLAAPSPDEGTRNSIVVYFELWLLKLAGYLPDWNRCHRCGGPVDHTSELSLTQDFHVSCLNCAKPRQLSTIGGGQRELAAIAQRLSPTDFLLASDKRVDDVNLLSATLKRMLSQAIGRDLVVSR
jgi:DNA repair protein RecO (recombination protein O)